MELEIRIVAIIALACLEGLALATGVDGATLSTVLMAIAGIAGYSIGQRKKQGGP